MIYRSVAGDGLNPRETFKSGLRIDLTSWIVSEPIGCIPRVGLKSYGGYPIPMAGSGRITRARSVKTRITHVTDGVRFMKSRKRKVRDI